MSKDLLRQRRKSRAIAVTVGTVLITSVLSFAPARSAVLFSQDTTESIGVVSDTDFSTPSTRLDNFLLSNDSIVQSVSWQGIYFDTGTPQSADDFTIRIYDYVNQQALGSLLGEFAVGDAVNRTDTGQDYSTNLDIYSYSANLSGGIALDAGNYWLAIFNNTSSDTDDNWYWAGQGNVPGLDGSIALIFASDLTQFSGVDYTFSVSGAVVPLPAALPLLASALGFFGFFGWRRKRAAAA